MLRLEQSLGSGPEIEKVIILSVLSGGQTTESEKERGRKREERRSALCGGENKLAWPLDEKKLPRRRGILLSALLVVRFVLPSAPCGEAL